MSTALDVARYLEAQGVGTIAAQTGWSIAVGSEPVAPNTTITIYDTGGPGPDTEQLDRRPSFQVRVRSHNYNDAFSKIAEVVNELQLITGVVLNGTRYASFEQMSDVAGLGKDDNERHILVTNFRVSNAEA